MSGPIVGNVMDGAKRSQRVEARISEVTQIPLWELWPQWHPAPPGKVVKVAGPVKIDGQVLSFVLLAIEDELVARLRLEKPYEVQQVHVARVYNALANPTQDDPNFKRNLGDCAKVYVDTFDYEGGPDLAGIFLRKPSSTRASATQIVSSGPNAKIAGRDMIGTQVKRKK